MPTDANAPQSLPPPEKKKSYLRLRKARVISEITNNVFETICTVLTIIALATALYLTFQMQGEKKASERQYEIVER